MGKMFSERFKDEYKFLEQYGFVFDVDPYNPNRLCYRNDYGEIVLWVKEDNSIILEKDIYVQINGWKKEINIKEDYRKYINRRTTFKSYSKMFKELFAYFLNMNGEFYGLKIYKSKFHIESSITDKDIKDEKYNPTKNKIGNTFLYGNLITIFTLVFLQLGIIISYEYIKSYDVYTVLRVILCVSMFVVSLITIFLLNKKLYLVSKIYMLLFPIILIYLIYFFLKRIDYIIYQSCFVFGLLYLICLVIYSFIKRNKNSLLNGIIIIIYPMLTLFVKSFELNNYIHGADKFIGTFFIISLIVAILFVILYLIFIKYKEDKKEYIGGLFASIFIPFLVLFIPLQISSEIINYSYDNSLIIEKEYHIVDKRIRQGTGRYSTRSYYLTVIIDGEKEDINTNRIIYEEFDIGDSITLLYREGYLNDDYYEINEDKLFNKNK